MKLIFEIPTEDFSAIQFHSAEELGIDFVQEVFARIRVSEFIIDRDFSAIKGKCAVCPHCANCNISENPTNGDMIRAMFPKYYQGILGYLDNTKWWNTPYKKEVEG